MADGLQMTGVAELRQRYALAHQRLRAAVGQVFQRRLTEAVTYAQQRYRTGGTTSDRTAVRTGALRAAISHRVSVAPTTVTGVFGYLQGNVPYAGVHEATSPTVIRPTRGQYLTIPLPAARTGAGQPRARDFANTFFARSRRGNLLLFQRQGTGVVPLFVLVRSVTVPPRPALQPTMDHFLPFIVQDVQAAALQAL
jgi:hypothetical protein